MAKAHLSQKVYHKSLTRKNQKTGKSNYPTVKNSKQKTTKYENGKKTINNRNYRKID